MITAYRKKVTVRSDGRIEIKDPGLKPGTKAEVIVLVENEPAKNTNASTEKRIDWQILFSETQQLPQVQTITEEEIAAEITAYRETQNHESAH